MIFCGLCFNSYRTYTFMDTFFFLLSQEYIYKKKNNIIEPQNKLVWNQENTKWKKIEIKQLIDT